MKGIKNCNNYYHIIIIIIGLYILFIGANFYHGGTLYRSG